MQIECCNKLGPVISSDKRVKILVGGRGSTKSTFVADYVLSCMSKGQLWCCSREYQNTIDESVHRTIIDEIDRLGFSGFEATKNNICHASGGRNFYKGLARNITSMKSTLSGVDGLWIEEGEDLSAETLRVLTASVRLNATDTQRKLAGEQVKMPEIIITMNRGSRSDPISKKYLERAERDLQATGFYEDDAVLIIELNYTDMPTEWFEASGLEVERLDDKANMSKSAYDSKWLGKYLEQIEDSIILPEWFDACIDAHKLDRFKVALDPFGPVVASHDPADGGTDPKSYCLRHGSVIKSVKELKLGDINEGCDWATGLARKDNADCFVWDADGMGSGLKRQVASEFDGTRTDYHTFYGSLSGKGMDNAQRIYMPVSGDTGKRKTMAQTFRNNRASYYTDLANRCHSTYRAVVRSEYIDPINMISFDSDGIENMDGFRSEVCHIARKHNPLGLIQIMSKKDMRSLGIHSPNMADVAMMSLFNPAVDSDCSELVFDSEF